MSFHADTSTGVTNVVNTISSTSSQATIDSNQLQNTVERLTRSRGLTAQSVSCPSSIPQEFNWKTNVYRLLQGW